MSLLEQIQDERPKFHRGETEIKGDFWVQESFLNRQRAENLAKNEPTCYGIGREVARFIYDSVNHESRTLETGAGISTLVFALKMSNHVAITPNEAEIAAIKEYAESKKIDLESITFVIETSDKYLPKCNVNDLDLVLIDGKHAFPWPIIDWFYTADRLKKGGLMIIDDVPFYSVGILKDFMNEDPRWKLYRSFGNSVFVFQKVAESIHNVAWHMQPYIINRRPRGSLIKNMLSRSRRVLSKLRHIISTFYRSYIQPLYLKAVEHIVW